MLQWALWMVALALVLCDLSAAGTEDNPAKWTWPVRTEVPGKRYEATVPDTLDLAARAEIALNVLTGALDPDANYELYFYVRFHADPPFMQHERTGLPTNNPKFAESMPMMRVMCGSNHNRDVETRNMESMVSAIGKDGLYYSLKANRPWHGAGEDFANLYGNVRLMLAMLAWHHLTGDPVWKTRIATMVNRFSEIAIQKEDYAFYPTSELGEWFSYGRKSGWLTKAEPVGHPTILYIGPVLRGLARWAEVCDDKQARELADRLARFVTKPVHWQAEADAKFIDSAARAHWNLHFHGWVAALRGLLRHAMLTRDADLMAFVRDGYDYSRNFGIPRIGWFHELTTTGTHCESCCIADMVALAITLCDAGVGDYWDDVDRYVRNQLVEQQFVDVELLRKASVGGDKHKHGPPQATTDRVIERNLGGFAGKALVEHIPGAWIMHCCTGNGTQALYYAWEAITRCNDGVAQVNLLINRASPWMDIDSCLPFEGKVVLRNKKARIVSVRIPLWVDRAKVAIDRAGRTVKPVWSGNYLVCSDLEPEEVITISFPVQERIERATLYNTKYTFRFRGNTVVDVQPRANPPGSYPMYLRDHMKAGKTPTKRKTRFVCDVLLPW